MSSKALWYLTRGSGIVALVLLTAAVVIGLLTAMRVSGRRWPRFLIEGLHRNVTLLGPVFLVVHIATAVLDSYVSLDWLNAVIPFGANYKPLWVGLGALSLDLFVAVAITSLVRVRLGYRSWRAVHWLAYGSWTLAVVHALGIGSDRNQGWMLGLTAICVAAVTLTGAYRLRFALATRARSDRAVRPGTTPGGAFS